MTQRTDPWQSATARFVQDRPLVSLGIAAFIALALMLWAFSPNPKVADETRIKNELEAGEITKIAEAPDGATVWAVKRDGNTIYFSKGSVSIQSDRRPNGL